MKKRILAITMMVFMVLGMVACTKAETTEKITSETETTDDIASVSVDAKTSASIVPGELVQNYKPKGFTESDKKKALFIIGDPRGYSVNYDLVNTAMKHFEDNGVEVELRDLYGMKFNPVVSLEEFYYAKDGKGEPSEDVKKEQELITKSDYIIFSYPNWHDTPNSMVKGYMERVFAKKFAYKNSEKGLEGLLKGKSIYTIMNAGFLGGGRGYIGNGVGIDDESWEKYMNAYKVLDDDTAGFWGLENRGRFVNDRTPKNNSENYKEEITKLRQDLMTELDKVYFK